MYLFNSLVDELFWVPEATLNVSDFFSARNKIQTLYSINLLKYSKKECSMLSSYEEIVNMSKMRS